jgi:hypothetical protein
MMLLGQESIRDVILGIALFALVALVAPGCRSTPRQQPTAIQRELHYPTHWWTPVPKEGAPAWEILPQEDRPGEVILSKRNELGLLSNFAPTPFTFRGQRYASLEGFWQMGGLNPRLFLAIVCP